MTDGKVKKKKKKKFPNTMNRDQPTDITRKHYFFPMAICHAIYRRITLTPAACCTYLPTYRHRQFSF